MLFTHIIILKYNKTIKCSNNMHITVIILCYVSLDFISHKIVNKGVSLGKKNLETKTEISRANYTSKY